MVDDHNLILAQNIIARAGQIAALSTDDLVRLNLTELDYQLEDATTAVHRARGLYDDQNGYTGAPKIAADDPNESLADKYRAIWELRVAVTDYTDAEFTTLLTRTGVSDAAEHVQAARHFIYRNPS